MGKEKDLKLQKALYEGKLKDKDKELMQKDNEILKIKLAYAEKMLGYMKK